LHTSDWHVGKAIRGRSRADEHAAVLAEVASVADRERADMVLVAGDLFDNAAPAPDAERIVYDALLALTAERTRPVIVIAGNHDSPHRLAAVAPVFAAHGVRVVANPIRAEDGGVIDLEAAGEVARIAVLPFPSQRTVVTAEALMRDYAGDHGQTYAERVRRILESLTSGFDDGGTVNIVLAHLMVMGGTMGGGERGAHTIFDYWVPTTAFPASAHYVALGHLHRAQRLDGPCPAHYCGAPLQLDFGETANEPVVHIVDAIAGKPATVSAVPLTAGRRLRVITGTPDALAALAGTTGDDHLKIVVDSTPRPGLADELRELFPTAVEVVLAARDLDTPADDRDRTRAGRSPHELFRAYLDERDVTDESLLALFDELVDDAVSA
jgi:exonuclease SbcD